MMKSMNFPFIKSLSIFTISNVINAAIPFLLLPVLTFYLSPADFGIISMFQVLLMILLPFAGFNSESSVIRYYYEKEKYNYASFITNALYLILIGAVVLIPVFFIFHEEIISLLFGAESHQVNQKWLWVMLAIAVSQNIFQVQQNFLQVQYRAVEYGIYRISKTALELGLSILLIVYVNNTWVSRMEGQLIPALLFMLIALFLLYKNRLLNGKFDWKSMKANLAYGLPLLPHVLSGVIMTFSDRIFITNMISASETGIYAVGYQVGMIMSLLQSSFNQAWVPWLFAKLKTNDEQIKLKIVKYTYLYFLLMIVCAALIILLAPLFFRVFIGDSFSGGLNFVFFIAIGFAVNGMYKMVVNYIFYIKKTYFIAVLTLVSASTSITLNFILIPEFGAIGAAYSTAIAFTVEFILAWILSASLYKMPWLYFITKKRSY
jgi:O-antigen/teichoic acid export membrane protein